jgi:FkbM family methyltransferase
LKHWKQITSILAARGVDLVFDIGANVGQYAGYLRDAGYEGRIVSFEPLSEAHEVLQLTSAHDARWTVAPRIALGERTGRAEINISAESDMSSLRPLAGRAMTFTPSSEMIGSEPVGMTTLAEVFDKYAAPDDTVFVKVDTQGYELAVLEGAAPVFDRVAGWQLELSLVEIYEGEPLWRPVVDHMTARGHDIHYVLPGYFSRHLGRMLQFDAMFFRG